MVKQGSFRIKAATDAKEVAWFNVKKLPKLAFDHAEIVKTAIGRLKGKIVYEPIGFELLPEKFPFSELEKLYSTVLDKQLDRRNFKKKILRFGFISETDIKQQLKGAGRRGNLHRFDQKRYFELKKKGINIEL